MMKFLDATIFSNKPASIADNVIPTRGIYNTDIWGPYPHDQTGPIHKPSVEAAIKDTKQDYIWFNVEGWPTGLEAEKAGTAQASLDKARELLEFARSVDPSKKYGLYGMPGQSLRQNWVYSWSAPDAASALWSAWRFMRDADSQGDEGHGSTKDTGVVNVVDYVCPSLYYGEYNPRDPKSDGYFQSKGEFCKWVRDTLVYMRGFYGERKPLHPFFDVSTLNCKEAVDIHAEAMRTCRNLGVTPILWGGYLMEWDPKAAWLSTLKL